VGVSKILVELISLDESRSEFAFKADALLTFEIKAEVQVKVKFLALKFPLLCHGYSFN
jgi:hypothetical protein